MSKLKKKVETTRKKKDKDSMSDWPFKISIKLRPVENNRVAFMSSQSRTYFPEDAGFSRFGIYYSMNTAPGDVPNPKYHPSEDHLQKPISKKGYSMGGLCGPRFVKNHLENNPAPNAYQKNIVPHAYKRKSRPKNKKQKTPVVLEAEVKLPSLEENTISILESTPLPQHHPAHGPINKERLRQLCLQTFIGFGSHLSVDRFGTEDTFHNVGVGYYDLRKKPAKLLTQNSFGMKPVKLIPPLVTRCNYEGHDKCSECDEILVTVDYYRTWRKIKNPFYNVQPQDRISTNDKDNVYLRDVEQNVSASTNRKYMFLCLCRKCYCRGMRGESKFWNRKEMPGLFQKTRHCSYIHQHNNLPIYTHKTSCNIIHKMQLKEILMSKYYKDACDRVLKQK